MQRSKVMWWIIIWPISCQLRFMDDHMTHILSIEIYGWSYDQYILTWDIWMIIWPISFNLRYMDDQLPISFNLRFMDDHMNHILSIEIYGWSYDPYLLTWDIWMIIWPIYCTLRCIFIWPIYHILRCTTDYNITHIL